MYICTVALSMYICRGAKAEATCNTPARPSALHLAAAGGHVLVARLLRACASASQRPSGGATLLALLARSAGDATHESTHEAPQQHPRHEQRARGGGHALGGGLDDLNTRVNLNTSVASLDLAQSAEAEVSERSEGGRRVGSGVGRVVHALGAGGEAP